MYTNKAELNSVTSLKTIETLLTLSGPHIIQTPNVLKKKQTNKQKNKKIDANGRNILITTFAMPLISLVFFKILRWRFYTNNLRKDRERSQR